MGLWVGVGVGLDGGLDAAAVETPTVSVMVTSGLPQGKAHMCE